MTETLLFWQAGNFRDDYLRLMKGGTETYLEQRASVDFVTDQSKTRAVVVVSVSDTPYDEMLGERLRSIGIPFDEILRPATGQDVFEKTRPDLVICRMPQTGLMHALGAAGVPTLLTFANIYRPPSADPAPLDKVRRVIRNRRVARAIKALNPTAVANHTWNASLSLVSVLGLPEELVVPWEWTRMTPAPTPHDPPEGPLALFFAGIVADTKGVGDLLAAVERLRAEGREIRLDIAGTGPDLDRYRAETAAWDDTGAVTFLGSTPHQEIGSRMRDADVVVVPSRHAYPEGLPNVIYETFAARTPLVASDHPSWANRLKDGRDAVIFPQMDAPALADAIRRLADDPALYSALSDEAPKALDRLYVGVSWYEIADHFLADPGNETGWRAGLSMAALRRKRPELFT